VSSCRCLKCSQLCFVIPITISLETDFLFFFISIGIESLDGRVVKIVDLDLTFNTTDVDLIDDTHIKC